MHKISEDRGWGSHVLALICMRTPTPPLSLAVQDSGMLTSQHVWRENLFFNKWKAISAIPTTTTVYFNEVVFPSVLRSTSLMAFPQHFPPPWPVPSIFPTKSLLSLGLPFTPSPSTCSVSILFIQHNSSLLSTWPNHLSLFRRMTSPMSSIASMFLTHSLLFLSLKLTPVIHLNILISLLCIFLISSTFVGHLSLPYNIAGLMHVSACFFITSACTPAIHLLASFLDALNSACFISFSHSSAFSHPNSVSKIDNSVSVSINKPYEYLLEKDWGCFLCLSVPKGERAASTNSNVQQLMPAGCKRVQISTAWLIQSRVWNHFCCIHRK